MKFIGQYLYNIVLGLDQFINVLLLGDPDESISTRVSRSIRSGNAKIWVFPLAKFIDLLFHNSLYSIEENHIENSYEPDEKAEKELWSWIND